MKNSSQHILRSPLLSSHCPFPSLLFMASKDVFMAKNKKNVSLSDANSVSETKVKAKSADKKPNFFVRIWRKIVKFCKDVKGEMKKVVWTSGNEVKKNTKLVVVTVVAVAVAIALVDTLCAWIINSFAGMIG